MLDIKTIQESLKDRNLKYVSQVVGLSYPTMLSLAGGENRDYSHRVIKTISEYLEAGVKIITCRESKAIEKN